MKISAALEDPKVIRKIQEHIGLDAKTVQLKPARGPKNNLLPTSEAESAKQLKIAELFAATKDDGKLRDSFPGYSHSNE